MQALFTLALTYRVFIIFLILFFVFLFRPTDLLCPTLTTPFLSLLLFFSLPFPLYFLAPYTASCSKKIFLSGYEADAVQIAVDVIGQGGGGRTVAVDYARQPPPCLVEALAVLKHLGAFRGASTASRFVNLKKIVQTLLTSESSGKAEWFLRSRQLLSP